MENKKEIPKPKKTGWVWPMQGRISAYYKEKRLNSKGAPYYHQGIDLADDPSRKTPIVAASSGKVIFADMGTNKNGHNGYGYCVNIDHGMGVVTRYAHCSKLFVKVGQQVENGQKIAIVGSTGHSTGPHLHYEEIVNGRRVDPMKRLPPRAK